MASVSLLNGSAKSSMINGPSKGQKSADNPHTLLQRCLDEGRVDVLRSLLAQIESSGKKAASVLDECSEDGGSLLHQAVLLGDADCLRTLLSAGANPCIQDDQGRTALQLVATDDLRNVFFQELLQSIAQSKLGRVCQLLSAGVPVNGVDSVASGNTPLHWAASFATEDVVKVLCEGGAETEAANARGETALMDAVARGDVPVTRRLLLRGADAARRNAQGDDVYAIASKRAPHLLQCLSVHGVDQRIRRSESVSSDLDRASVLSLDTASPPSVAAAAPKTLPTDRLLLRGERAQLQSWTDILWPQPKLLQLGKTGSAYTLPADRKLRLAFHPASEVCARDLLRTVLLAAPLLASRQIVFVWGCHDEGEPSSGGGVPKKSDEGVDLLVGVFGGPFEKAESYTLEIDEHAVRLFAADLRGLRNGVFTLAQIIRTHPTVDAAETMRLPALVVRDAPDNKIRGVFMDFTGCRIFTLDTICQIVTRLAYCKANSLFIHFELRPTDKFALPFSKRDLFHLQQVCGELCVDLVPSLDLNSSYVEPAVARDLLSQFVGLFVECRSMHFGEHLAEIALKERSIISLAQNHFKMVYLSLDSFANLPEGPQPPFCIFCVPAGFPLNGPSSSPNSSAPSIPDLPASRNLCLKFTTSDLGYFCQAPESMVKNAILAGKLGTRIPVLGALVCDQSTGCEIMPQSLAYLPEVAVLGAAWNRDTDMKRFCFLLPQIGAEHVLLDRKMSPLFEQLLTLGYVEHELTKMGHGLIGVREGATPKRISSTLSVFVEMLLNPNNMALDQLTPQAFKRARIELKKSLVALAEVRKELPYNYELALTLAEIQLVTEMMVLASRMGQSLCVHGNNPSAGSAVGVHVINVGVANLPLTTRTDLANALLELRSKFQHTWLSRNLPVTLPNALKMFDNLFRTLLPPQMQAFGEELL